ncbi:unnamed protein product [Effrenium voratum]|nr:unnamed protein product [Effrenium voratum]
MWLDDKSLEEVLQRAKELGQMSTSQEDAQPGFILEGDWVDLVARSEDLAFDALRPMITKLSGPEAHVYTVSKENCFEQEGAVWRPTAQLTPQERQGSLNTTWDYKKTPRTGVELLDDYFLRISELLHPCDAADLNQRLYLIWKLPHYVTSYHQDTHVPPHFTLYNQVSGVSIFHFMPVLVGLYLTHVGQRNVFELKRALERLDELRVGSLAVLGPGQVALIAPTGSHGVWVPCPHYTPAMAGRGSVSVIRAAELFLRPIFQALSERLMKDDWPDVMKVEDD